MHRDDSISPDAAPVISTARLDQTVDVNSDNIDELLDDMTRVSENLSGFTATIKARPYTLIRASNPREHKTGEPK